MQQTGVANQATRGVAMIVALVFLVIFACMALAIASAADVNLCIARNRVARDQAAALAETGLLLVQQQLGGLPIPRTHSAMDINQAVAARLTANWAASTMLDTAAIHCTLDGVVLPPITVPLADGQSGTIEILVGADGGSLDRATLSVRSIGRFANAARTVSYAMTVRSDLDALAKYGVASRSPVEMKGNASIQGANHPSEGSILSATNATLDAVTLTGHVSVSGDVVVTGAGATIDTRGSVTIGGDELCNAPQPAWPQVNTAPFEACATNPYIPGQQILTNVRVPAGTDPTFNADMIVRGVLFVESPNNVTFNGNASVQGVVVMQDHAPGLPANAITFSGNVSAQTVDSLPSDSQFDAVRELDGTFLLAPGAHATFAGNFGTVGGWLVASGYEFSGSAGGTIHGAVLNLEDSSFMVNGDVHLVIDKSGAGAADPTGLVASYSLICVRGSYSE